MTPSPIQQRASRLLLQVGSLADTQPESGVAARRAGNGPLPFTAPAALLLLAAAASASLSASLAAPWWLLAAFIPGLAVVGSSRRRCRTYPGLSRLWTGSVSADSKDAAGASEVQIATIYERSGRLVLRRRQP